MSKGLLNYWLLMGLVFMAGRLYTFGEQPCVLSVATMCVWTCPLCAFLDYLDVNVHEVSFVCSVTIKCCGDVSPIVNHRGMLLAR